MSGHQWAPSNLGHGNSMCLNCLATDLEAAALGIMNECEAAKPTTPVPVEASELLDQLKGHLARNDVDTACEQAFDRLAADLAVAPQPVQGIEAEELADDIAWLKRMGSDGVAPNLFGQGYSVCQKRIARILSRLTPITAGEGEDATPYKDALHDLVMLRAQQDIGCVPAPTSEQWAKAWAEAEELTRIEP